jgi:hypothetical protein
VLQKKWLGVEKQADDELAADEVGGDVMLPVVAVVEQLEV